MNSSKEFSDEEWRKTLQYLFWGLISLIHLCVCVADKELPAVIGWLSFDINIGFVFMYIIFLLHYSTKVSGRKNIQRLYRGQFWWVIIYGLLVFSSLFMQ